MTKIKFIIQIALICLFVLLTQIMGNSSAHAFCGSNFDCGPDRFKGEQFCQGNSLYQDYESYTCNNPGANYSSCVASKSPRLVQTCSQGCEQGLWYTGCAEKNKNSNVQTGAVQCYSHSYQRCVGNSLYWFDSCNNRQDWSKTCASGQICQNNACITNYITAYTSHSVKGCFKNIVYWYDSLGNQQDIYQNCNFTGQICQDGQCVPNPNYVQTYKASETNNQKEEIVQTPSQAPPQTQDQDQNKSNIIAAVSENPSIVDFVKKWYVWPIIIAVLIFLFIIIFKKLSSRV